MLNDRIRNIYRLHVERTYAYTCMTQFRVNNWQLIHKPIQFRRLSALQLVRRFPSKILCSQRQLQPPPGNGISLTIKLPELKTTVTINSKTLSFFNE